MSIQRLNHKKTDPIIVFDLDGTISRYDTAKIALIWRFVAQPGRLVLLPFILYSFVRWKMFKISSTQFKRRVFALIWASGDRVERPPRVTTLIFILTRIFVMTKARAEIRYHSSRGARVILATASPEIYVRELASAIGITEYLCTTVRYVKFGSKTIPLLGVNCIGSKKAKMVINLCGGAPDAFYSDSEMDLPLLELCASPRVVNPCPKLRRIATDRKWRIYQW